MPKATRGGASRAPKNFDPRYGERAKASKTIGRTHRGYRDPAETGGGKQRWNAEERAGREQARNISDGARGERSTRDGRDFSARDDRGGRGFAPREDRGGRNFAPREDRGGRGFAARDDRGGRSSASRDERGGRDFRDDRAPRTDRGGFRSDDRRGGRDFSPREDRGGRNFAPRDDRGGRSFSPRDDRGGRSFAPRNERGGRDFAPRDDRGGRSFAPRDDRGGRSFAPREDRGGRDFAPRNDRGGRDFAPRNDRGGRDFAPRDDRGGRGGFRSDDRRDGARGGRDFTPRDDRGARRDERPVRRDRDDRPARRDEHASRSDWAATKPAHDVVEDVVHERLKAEAVSAADITDVTFASLGLGDNIVRALADLGAPTPFPIQAATIPDILAGRDTLGRGRTGSGKTIAFGAPLVEAILRSKAGVKREFGRAPSAIILAPTRELALQIDRTVQPIARSVGLFTTQIYGGVPQARQVGALKKGVDIIIGTPGRIEDLQKQGKLDLSEIQIAVLDEADHMCDLGFLEPVQRILRSTADGSQKLLFSATLDREVEALVREFLVEPAVYEVAGETQDTGTIDHKVLVIEHREKADMLTSLVDRDGKTLVFTRTRAYAEMLAEQFEEAGISAVALHGDLNQAKRTRNLHRMTSGRANVLVATDVAARGIHVDDIDLVIQADAPDEYKTYLHRAGRTGRAGNHGTVVTLVTRGRSRRMTELLDRADIDAPFINTGLDDEILDELTGRSLTLAEVTA